MIVILYLIFSNSLSNFNKRIQNQNHTLDKLGPMKAQNQPLSNPTIQIPTKKNYL